MVDAPLNQLFIYGTLIPGEERWVYDPQIRISGYATDADPEGLRSPAFANCRGVAYWKDADAEPDQACAQRLFMATNDLRLVAVDARRGGLCDDFGDQGIVNAEPLVLNAEPPAVSFTFSPSGSAAPSWPDVRFRSEVRLSS